MNIQGAHVEVVCTNEMTPRLEAGQPRAVPDQSTISNQETATPTPTRVNPVPPVRQYVLETREPIPTWRHWRNGSFLAQTLFTIFDEVDRISQFCEVDTAHMILEIHDQRWIYTIMRDDDPEEFEGLQRSIIADVQGTMRRDRNKNIDFKIYYEPVGANPIDNEIVEEVEDVFILGY